MGNLFSHGKVHGFLAHLTDPDYLEASDRLAGRQSDKKWEKGKGAARQQKKTCTTGGAWDRFYRIVPQY